MDKELKEPRLFYEQDGGKLFGTKRKKVEGRAGEQSFVEEAPLLVSGMPASQASMIP